MSHGRKAGLAEFLVREGIIEALDVVTERMALE